MRLLFATFLVAGFAATTLSARDTVDDRRPGRSQMDADRRERLKQYLAAFRNLSPDMKDHVRLIDKELKEEDEATRARLTGVMERYAMWLSRLSEGDRSRVQAAPAGPERLRAVREVMDQQWLDNLPPTHKDLLAKSTEAERKTLVERWHKEERDRNDALRVAQEMAILGQDQRMKLFRDEVAKYVKTDLEPKLTPKEKSRLQTIRERAPLGFNYMKQVLVLSETHKLTPPGPPDIWDRFRQPRRP